VKDEEQRKRLLNAVGKDPKKLENLLNKVGDAKKLEHLLKKVSNVGQLERQLSVVSNKLYAGALKNLLAKDLDLYDIERLRQVCRPNGQLLTPNELERLAQELDRSALLDLIKQEVKIGAEQIRQIYIHKPFPKGNVANVEIYLEDGISFGAAATSRFQSPAPQPLPRSQGGQFEPIIDSYSGRLMDTDSEYKALSAIADQLDEANYGSQLQGKIYLYTERAPCESCTGVIRQFNEKFPNIELEVFSDYLYPYQL